ncbi:BMP family ABC transporter substrate-binding protein [Lachnoclostridium sp. An14]|uniref:BMP family ABC transporter substrate-binding protein n=1 Tax=Lachnoclostridium sp. An14 TaxID=1965562 RepID=UPI000B377064|nr:BMP family ABC transporter substrate-binding protein [Lachnoclostridium sp. An14]OUQ20135.1 BMP family ABC transporter substrate-binding protein [Lachnoclostridium sp. An14]
MRKTWKKAVALIAAAALLAGCGQSSDEGSSSAAAENAAGSEMAAMIISIAQGDPFLVLAYDGVEQLGEEYGVETKIIEALDKSEYSEQIRAMAEAGANPIYVVWDDLAAEAIKIAPDFPDTKFIVVDCYVTSELENVKTIVVEPQEAAFIAGVVAANTTETNKVSWIGSADQPVINKFRAGFEAGVSYADPSVECESLYIGDANDPNKGSELTKQVIGKGADIVMHSANKAGLGVIRACEEEGVKAIGADEWQGSINEDVVFWSALKDITGAVYQAGKSALDGSFTAGMDVYNIKSGSRLYDERDYEKLPDEVKKAVDEVEEKMRNGEIEVPSDVE